MVNQVTAEVRTALNLSLITITPVHKVAVVMETYLDKL